MSNKSSGTYHYKVFVDDNFHYMDEEYRYQLATFEECASAVAACKRIVDEFLTNTYSPGMSSKELWRQYFSFGEDPWIASDDPECRGFSSWQYAKDRCGTICADRGLRGLVFRALKRRS